MYKAYVIIIATLFAIPVIASAIAVIWICFRMSATAGSIALAVCLAVIAVCTVAVVCKMRGGGVRK